MPDEPILVINSGSSSLKFGLYAQRSSRRPSLLPSGIESCTAARIWSLTSSSLLLCSKSCRTASISPRFTFRQRCASSNLQNDRIQSFRNLPVSIPLSTRRFPNWRHDSRSYARSSTKGFAATASTDFPTNQSFISSAKIFRAEP